MSPSTSPRYRRHRPAPRARTIRPAVAARVAGALLIWLGAASPRGFADNYSKVFYVNNVAAGAGITAGAQAETWTGNKKVNDTITVQGNGANAIKIQNSHANNSTGAMTINGGFPITAVKNVTVDTKGGYTPAAITQTDKANAANTATASLAVDQRVAGNGPTVTIRTGNQSLGNVVLVDSVKATISGSATAGAANDAPFHSADSFGAINIAGAQTFLVTKAGDIPTVSVFGQDTIKGGDINGTAKGNPNPANAVRDPYVVTVTDQTTGQVVASQSVMSQNLDYHNASYSIDDTGIHLSVAANDPTAFVTLSFSTDTSSGWLLNNYNYGATLTDAGLSAYGETPMSGWTVTQNGSEIDAFFAFANGQPLDDAFVLPPSALFESEGSFTGDTYTYDVGTSMGVFTFAAAVPEPPALTMLATGLAGVLGLSAWRRTRNRPATAGSRAGRPRAGK
jgi:hypothetical protein